MKRRLYFLFPQPSQVHAVVEEIASKGIRTVAMHVIAKQGIDLSGLPVATRRQQQDTLHRIEHILWDSNLVLFFIAFGLMLIFIIMVT